MYLLMVLCLFVGSAYAQPHEVNGLAEIRIEPGFAVILRMGKPFKTVIIGNDRIADATPADTNTDLVLTGKEIGATNLILLDEYSRTVHSAIVLVGQQFGGRTQIHNQRDLTKFDVYQCTPTGCRAVAITPKIPPLPPGSTITIPVQ